MRLTPEGYAKKVRRLLERFPDETVAVFEDADGGLHFTRARSMPRLVAIYDRSVEESWLIEDAEELRLSQDLQEVA